ncbi:MAG TPA: winged helix-turn-helix domain-containing protein, partial [Reyranella sp.]
MLKIAAVRHDFIPLELLVATHRRRRTSAAWGFGCGLSADKLARQVKSGKMADGFRVVTDDFHAVTMNGQEISFGPFRLLADQRLLLEGDRPVRLGSRAFDILAALVERPGEVLGKEQLIARAWPQTVVE